MLHRILAVLVDSGDTLVDEATEVKDAADVTLRAGLIPGAREMLEQVKARGYPIALVADGPAATFRNIIAQHDLSRFFDAYAISKEVGHDKPHPAMFERALAQLGIPASEAGRVVMVGNNLARDVKGANEFGIISVWLDWSPRRSRIPADALEIPRYTIHTPLELLAVLDELENEQQFP